MGLMRGALAKLGPDRLTKTNEQLHGLGIRHICS